MNAATNQHIRLFVLISVFNLLHFHLVQQLPKTITFQEEVGKAPTTFAIVSDICAFGFAIGIEAR